MSGSTPSDNSRKNARIADDVDRISNLPDDVITHILSNLPIKDAVRTCVLSSDWEFKWTSIYNLHIEDKDFFSGRRRVIGDSFRNIFDKILLHLNSIKSFRLECGNDKPLAEPYVVASWISAVLRQWNIESVELNAVCIANQKDFVLPRSLLSCTSLRNLSVEILWGCIFKVPAKVCFPSLTNLNLDSVKIVNELSSVDTVKFTFPVLEKLALRDCEWLKVKCVEFFAPSMTSFSTSNSRFSDLDYSIKIIKSRLIGFVAHGHSPDNYVLIDTSVVSVSLSLWTSCFEWTDDVGILGELGFRIRKFLREFSSLQYLDLTGDALEAMGRSKASPSLPKYSELKRLNVCSLFDLDVEGLLEILHASPFMEILIITMNDRNNEYNFDTIELVPSCILSHL